MTPTPTQQAGTAAPSRRSSTAAGPGRRRPAAPSAPTGPPGGSPFLPAAAQSYLDRAAASLREAITSDDVPERYALAHVSALRSAAAVLAARARPQAVGARTRPQRNAWVLLAEVAPELTEWAQFFAAGATKRAAAEAGSPHAVSAREADDLVRDADRFLAIVETSLGLFEHRPIQVA